MHNFNAIFEFKLELRSGNGWVGSWPLWPWPFAWTSHLSLVVTPENFRMIRWWEQSEKGTDRQTDGRTDRQKCSSSCLVAAKKLTHISPIGDPAKSVYNIHSYVYQTFWNFTSSWQYHCGTQCKISKHIDNSNNSWNILQKLDILISPSMSQPPWHTSRPSPSPSSAPPAAPVVVYSPPPSSSPGPSYWSPPPRSWIAGPLPACKVTEITLDVLHCFE